MENRLDELFRNKLSGNRIEPSEDAWNKLNDGLARKRKKKLVARLAVAASLALICTFIFIDYKSKENSPVESTGSLADNPETVDKNAMQTPAFTHVDDAVSKNPETTLNSENQTIKDAEIDGYDQELAQNTAEISGKKKFQEESMADNQLTKEENLSAEAEDELNQTEEPILAQLKVENNEELVDQPDEKLVDLPEEQSMVAKADREYAPIKIVYKASKNSALVEDNSKGLIEKGINKITRFSNEHVVTTEVKTKLRNTKDDLLALNIGKLLNKSSNNAEN